MDVLVHKNLIQRRRGAGTFVQSPAPEVDLFLWPGLPRRFSPRHRDRKTLVTPVKVTPVTNQPRNPFNESTAYYFSRLIKAQGTPLLKEDMYLDTDLFRGLDRVNLGTRSLSGPWRICIT